MRFFVATNTQEESSNKVCCSTDFSLNTTVKERRTVSRDLLIQGELAMPRLGIQSICGREMKGLLL